MPSPRTPPSSAALKVGPRLRNRQWKRKLEQMSRLPKHRCGHNIEQKEGTSSNAGVRLNPRPLPFFDRFDSCVCSVNLGLMIDTV